MTLLEVRYFRLQESVHVMLLLEKEVNQAYIVESGIRTLCMYYKNVIMESVQRSYSICLR